MKTQMKLGRTAIALTLVLGTTALFGCSGREIAGPEMADAPPILSDFEEGTDAWSGAGDFEQIRTRSGSVAVQGRYLSGSDRATGAIWYFAAPRKFLGDKSAYFGGELSYYMLAAKADGSAPTGSSYVGGPAVIIHGARMNLEYRINARYFPSPEAFKEYRISLSPGPSWRINGEVATEAQFREVLAEVEWLRIRGEYFNVDDYAYLDEVRLAGPR